MRPSVAEARLHAERAEPLSYPAVIKLASVLRLEDDAFIVGGQALNLWAERYFAVDSSLAEYAPYTSKDLDYFGHREAAQKLADALDGKAIFPHPDDHTPNSALVRATVLGQEIEVDFLSHVLGVRALELERLAVELSVPLRDGGTLEIPVMHPLHCLQSRVANVIKLDRRDDVALRQLAASPIVLRGYISEMLDSEDFKEVKKTLQSLFHYLRTDEFGLKIPELEMPDPLDLFGSLTSDRRIDWRYRWFNLRIMRRQIRQKRHSRSVNATRMQHAKLQP